MLNLRGICKALNTKICEMQVMVFWYWDIQSPLNVSFKALDKNSINEPGSIHICGSLATICYREVHSMSYYTFIREFWKYFGASATCFGVPINTCPFQKPKATRTNVILRCSKHPQCSGLLIQNCLTWEISPQKFQSSSGKLSFGPKSTSAFLYYIMFIGIWNWELSLCIHPRSLSMKI